jgi:XTP/dITP diphosphohydrolase
LFVFRLLLATRNAHKTREFAQILEPDCEVFDLSNAPDIPEAEESGRTFEENAISKAVAVSRVVTGLVVADDSGLEVAALGGAPGVYSARYAGKGAKDEENVAKLLSELLKNKLGADRGARFCCVLALSCQGELISVFRGEVAGVIADRPRGSGGFGYDPVFTPAGFDQTFAELGEEVKNQISHRAVAIKKLREQLPRLRR